MCIEFSVWCSVVILFHFLLLYFIRIIINNFHHHIIHIWFLFKYFSILLLVTHEYEYFPLCIDYLSTYNYITCTNSFAHTFTYIHTCTQFTRIQLCQYIYSRLYIHRKVQACVINSCKSTCMRIKALTHTARYVMTSEMCRKEIVWCIFSFFFFIVFVFVFLYEQ